MGSRFAVRRLASNLATATVFAGLVGSTTPLEAELFRVRAGSQVLACGGFAGGCQTLVLGGTFELDTATTVPEEPAPVLLVVTTTDLALTTGLGGTFPFPADGDLPLAGLEGPLVGGQAEVSAQNEHGQSVELRFQQLQRNFADSTPISYLMQGRYDEACCDRFVYELGTVVLDRVPDESAVNLDGDGVDRFRVRVHWKETPSGPSRNAVPERTGGNAAQFWFFEPDNPEIFVKLVPACEEQFGNLVWVFLAGLTDLDVTVVVTDTSTEREWVRESTLGQPFPSVSDTEAFPCLTRLE